jgi:hypothetical protein
MIGPYFVVRLDPASPGMPSDEFFQPPVLSGVIDDVARRVGTGEPRVAVSSLQYELAERFWSVVLGCWATEALIPDLDQLRYGRSPAGRVRLHLQNPTARERGDATPTETAIVIAEVVVGLLAVLHRPLRSITPVAEGLLWGNAATALVLATRTLLNRGERHEGLAAVSRALLAMPPLTDRLEGDITGRIVRRTCCLYYRTAARRACGDCPLTGSAAVKARA